MDLARNPDTSVVHRTGCHRAARVAVHWKYGDAIPGEAELSRETMSYFWLHLCNDCLPGVCRCRKCDRKITAAIFGEEEENPPQEPGGPS